MILTDTYLSSPKRLAEVGQFRYDANNLAIRFGKKQHTWMIKTRTSAEIIGYFPRTMTLAQARAFAADRADRVRFNVPFNVSVVEGRGALLTMGELLDRYERARQKDGLKTLHQAMQILRRGFKDYLKADMLGFSKLDMRAAHSSMSDGGRHAGGNLFLRYACAMFNWAIHEDLVETNWTKFVKRAKVKPRERVLTMAELAAIWLATERYAAEGSDQGRDSRSAYARMIRFLMLTGQRLGEAADLKHGHIVAGQWTQTENKMSRTHRLRLSPAALAEVGMGAHPLNRVFWSGHKQRLNNFGDRMNVLHELSGVTDWSAHTLRHSMVTHLAEAGIPLEVTEALLNHKLGGVAGVYHHAKHEGPKADALKLWADMIEAQVVKARRAA